MNAKDIKAKVWSKIHEYADTDGIGEKPAFVILHYNAIRAIAIEFWENPSDLAYCPKYRPGDIDRIFGIPLFGSYEINEDEVLLGITPLKPKKL